MKLEKFYKLKNELETHSFETNFKSLSTTLYYFSFLGNIFLILFSYFFIKDVTNSIPALFTGQALFFSIFIVLFMTGYELFKRFAFEQLTATILRVKKATFNVIIGTIVSFILVSGSFYLSLNGAHRLIDTSDSITLNTESSISSKADSVGRYYDKEIEFYRTQTARSRADRKYRDSIVNALQITKDQKIAEITSKAGSSSALKVEELKENNTAFAVMVFFLELIILVGVAFNAYYVWNAYNEMKTLLRSTHYRQIELNLQLLKLYYQNGRKKEGDPVISKNKFKALLRSSNIDAKLKDIDTFISLCTELEIVRGLRAKQLNLSYEKAKEIITSQENF